MDIPMFENRIKDLLEKKISDNDLSFLHGFFEIKDVYKYSFFNQVLISLQGGTIALGFHRWNQLGRHINKGSHANIEILIPNIKVTNVQKPGVGEVEREDRLVGFFTKKVFDIKQTNGKDLEYTNNSVQTIDIDYLSLKLKIGEALKIDIREDFTGEARGFYTYLKDSITISTMNNNVDRIKVLLHEVGHYLLHKDVKDLPHPAKEVEAELVALLVASTLGIDCANNELYIQAYNRHKPEIRVLKIIGAVQRIINILK